nr:hypothetical protein DOP62_06975 [Synechococcus elongatus PCC 11801]
MVQIIVLRNQQFSSIEFISIEIASDCWIYFWRFLVDFPQSRFALFYYFFGLYQVEMFSEIQTAQLTDINTKKAFKTAKC